MGQVHKGLDSFTLKTEDLSFPSSKKIFRQGKLFSDVQVPEREIQLSNKTTLNVYDTSGPYTDTDTSIIGAFLAVNSSPLDATAHAMTVQGVSGEIAAEKAKAPGSFQVAFIDALYLLSSAELKGKTRLKYEKHPV